MQEQTFRVLLVDDSADYRMLLALVFGQDDRFVVVGEASDGAEGVQMAKALMPDVVLLDVAMPVMDGLQALRLIRSAAPQSCVVMLTGFDGDELRESALAGGARACLRKGISAQALVEDVLEACRYLDPPVR